MSGKKEKYILAIRSLPTANYKYGDLIPEDGRFTKETNQIDTLLNVPVGLDHETRAIGKVFDEWVHPADGSKIAMVYINERAVDSVVPDIKGGFLGGASPLFKLIEVTHKDGSKTMKRKYDELTLTRKPALDGEGGSEILFGAPKSVINLKSQEHINAISKLGCSLERFQHSLSLLDPKPKTSMDATQNNAAVNAQQSGGQVPPAQNNGQQNPPPAGQDATPDISKMTPQEKAEFIKKHTTPDQIAKLDQEQLRTYMALTMGLDPEKLPNTPSSMTAGQQNNTPQTPNATNPSPAQNPQLNPMEDRLKKLENELKEQTHSRIDALRNAWINSAKYLENGEANDIAKEAKAQVDQVAQRAQLEPFSDSLKDALTQAERTVKILAYSAQKVQEINNLKINIPQQQTKTQVDIGALLRPGSGTPGPIRNQMDNQRTDPYGRPEDQQRKPNLNAPPTEQQIANMILSRMSHNGPEEMGVNMSYQVGDGRKPEVNGYGNQAHRSFY